MKIALRSGGQTGADFGGIHAGYVLKQSKVLPIEIELGGVMPNGFRTLNGPQPQYALLYNMREHKSAAYPPRTFENVKESQGTIRIAKFMNSAGEKCTLKAITQYGRPHFDVHVRDTATFELPPEEHPKAAAQWLIDKEITNLNIAGNSESTCPGIELFAERYIDAMLRAWVELNK